MASPKTLAKRATNGTQRSCKACFGTGKVRVVQTATETNGNKETYQIVRRPSERDEKRTAAAHWRSFVGDDYGYGRKLLVDSKLTKLPPRKLRATYPVEVEDCSCILVGQFKAQDKQRKRVLRERLKAMRNAKAKTTKTEETNVSSGDDRKHIGSDAAPTS